MAKEEIKTAKQTQTSTIPGSHVLVCMNKVNEAHVYDAYKAPWIH